MQIKITLITAISVLYYSLMNYFFLGDINKIDFVFPTIISCFLIIKNSEKKWVDYINDIIYSILIIMIMFIFL